MKKMQALKCPLTALCRCAGTRRKAHAVPFPTTHPAYLLASWFWSGRLTPASGTWGTLASLPFWYLIFQLGSFTLYIGALVALLIVGALAVEHIETKTDRAQTHDAGLFVVDEVLGMGITLLPLAYFGTFYWPVWLWWGLAFVLFRLFDLFKIWPARLIDTRLRNGWGVMLDDLVAGLHAGLVMLAIYFGLSTWYLCAISANCMGTDGELIFFIGVYSVPLLAFFGLCAFLPWLYSKIFRK